MQHLWNCFWFHDQFFATIIVGIIGMLIWRKAKKAEAGMAVQADVYREALALLENWNATNRIAKQANAETDSDKEVKEAIAVNIESTYKLIDKIRVFGSPALKKLISNLETSSMSLPPQPWITPLNIEEFLYLIREDLGLLSFREKLKHFLIGYFNFRR